MQPLKTISELDLLRLALKAVESELDLLNKKIEKFPQWREFLTSQKNEYEPIRKELIKAIDSLSQIEN